MLLLEIEDANARKKKFLNSIPRLGLLDTTMLHDTYVEARPVAHHLFPQPLLCLLWIWSSSNNYK